MVRAVVHSMRHEASCAPRALSSDEKKAAEAAFQGRPFNESWTRGSRAIYDGIRAAMHRLKRQPEDFWMLQPGANAEETEEADGVPAALGPEHD